MDAIETNLVLEIINVLNVGISKKTQNSFVNKNYKCMILESYKKEDR